MVQNGTYVVFASNGAGVLQMRAMGYSLRDTLLILLPGPRLELAFLFKAPGIGSITETALKLGSGALNIDECRLSGGRWPSNLMLVHSPTCDTVGGCAQPCPAKLLDAPVGARTSGKPSGFRNSTRGYGGNIAVGTRVSGYGDSGGVSRFFHQFQERGDVLGWLKRLIET